MSKRDQLPAALEQELNQLQFLTDEELWQAARMTAATRETDQMQFLLEKQQYAGLTKAERQEAELLSASFNRIMLIRAAAAVQLKRRGRDISSLIPTPKG